MYSCCGNDVISARKMFDGFEKNGSVWNAMLAAYAKVGDVCNARKLFDFMPQMDKNVISWTTLISGYTQNHNPNEAIKLFRRMQLENVKPDEIAILAVLSACADLGALHLGEWIHNYIEKHKLSKIVPIYNSLIDILAIAEIIHSCPIPMLHSVDGVNLGRQERLCGMQVWKRFRVSVLLR
ncbi:hypothetical protein TSUD_16960 [Trifolium subterraneum]|uniref:Pentacotripeptide-repeat region of PRORP domain-containing protein n=1 Tax=Trifolium subterraneum TaxID=3900 RepID=A0A2Z6MXX9_TRISU|nr:hypothetical protein TSUD_16960 [Trifolium subterraneum]